MLLRILRRLTTLSAKSKTGFVPPESQPDTVSTWEFRRESDYFHQVLTSRSAYVVGKTKSIELVNAPKIVQDFLEASPSTVCPDLVTDLR